MNDVERELRELLERKAGSVGGVAPRLPGTVHKRGRRRQAGTAAIGAFTVAAVALVSLAGLRAIGSGDGDRRAPVPADDPWAGYDVFERTARVGGFTVTSPSDWYLVDQRRWAQEISVGDRAAFRRAVELCADEPTGDRADNCRSGLMGLPGDGSVIPELMLSNTDRGLTSSPCVDPAFTVGPTEAVMTIAFDNLHYFANRGQADGRPQWPVAFNTPAAEDRQSCGAGKYVYFTTADFPYVAHLAMGAALPERERQTLIGAFETMQVQAWFDGSRRNEPSGAYVIAGGENAAGPWTLELREQTTPGSVTDVQLEIVGVEGPGLQALGPFSVDEEKPIEQAGGDPTFGAVTKGASGVELRLEEGTPPITATIVPLPPSLAYPFDLFFASNPSDVPATAVALGVDDGRSSQTASVDPSL